MRELSFRAKRVENQKWVYGFYVNCRGPMDPSHYTRHYILEYPDVWHEIYTSTIGQYIGMKDKTGKKIYEGDILAGHLDDQYPEDETMCVVVWDGKENRWSVRQVCFDGIPDPIEQEDEGLWAVVGNVYDNPELSGGITK